VERSRRLRILASTLPLQFAFGLNYSWGAVAPYIERDEHWAPLLVGAVFTAVPVGYGTGIAVGGRLADRLPPRRLLWTSLGLYVLGVGTALSFPSGIALAGCIAAARHALGRRQGGAGGLATAAFALAAPVQVPAMSLLAQATGWLAAMRLLAVVMLFVAALPLLFMPAVPPPPRHAEAPHPPVRKVALRPRVWTALLFEVGGSAAGSYAFVAAATYAQRLALGPRVAASAITGVALGNVIGRLGAGALSDVRGVDRLMVGVVVANLLGVLALFSAAGPAAVVLGALLAGVGLGGAAGVISRLSFDAAPDAPNFAFGVIFLGFTAGAAGGSLGGSAISGRGAWAAVGLLPLMAMLVLAARRRLLGDAELALQR
jgi:predicted MFS family arabinose efflux permease